MLVEVSPWHGPFSHWLPEKPESQVQLHVEPEIAGEPLPLQ